MFCMLAAEAMNGTRSVAFSLGRQLPETGNGLAAIYPFGANNMRASVQTAGGENRNNMLHKDYEAAVVSMSHASPGFNEASVNGTPRAQASANGVVDDRENYGWHVMGASVNNYYFEGYVGICCAFNTALSYYERMAVEAWIRARYTHNFEPTPL